MSRERSGERATLAALDAEKHYSDGSHRWVAPRGVDQATWNVSMQIHLAAHRASARGDGDLHEHR